MASSLTEEELALLPPPPPNYMDFPYEAQEAIRIFANLPDIISDMAGFCGKDYSAIPLFFDTFEVPKISRVVVLELIFLINNHTVTKARAKMKQQSKSTGQSPVKNITSKRR